MVTEKQCGGRQATLIRSNSGFSLIELLIVMVILGILGGITLFAVGQFKSDSETACSNNNTRINETVSGAAAAGSSGSYTASTASC